MSKRPCVQILSNLRTFVSELSGKLEPMLVLTSIMLAWSPLVHFFPFPMCSSLECVPHVPHTPRKLGQRSALIDADRRFDSISMRTKCIHSSRFFWMASHCSSSNHKRIVFQTYRACVEENFTAVNVICQSMWSTQVVRAELSVWAKAF